MIELKAVLWDHDGTLVDTEPYWIQAELELARAYNVSWTYQDAIACVGSPMTETARRMQMSGVPLENHVIIETLVDRVDVLMDEQGISWLPGVQDLFAELVEAGIPCAIVSNAWRKLVVRTVAGLPEGAVKVFITGDEMLRAKPDPWSYAHAAELLDVPVKNAIAIEDSLAGTLSAEAADMPVLVVPSVTEVPAEPGRSRAQSLEGITLSTLREIVNGRVLEFSMT